jgi:hypothetical protein
MGKQQYKQGSTIITKVSKGFEHAVPYALQSFLCTLKMDCQILNGSIAMCLPALSQSHQVHFRG